MNIIVWEILLLYQIFFHLLIIISDKHGIYE